MTKYRFDGAGLNRRHPLDRDDSLRRLYPLFSYLRVNDTRVASLARRSARSLNDLLACSTPRKSSSIQHPKFGLSSPLRLGDNTLSSPSSVQSLSRSCLTHSRAFEHVHRRSPYKSPPEDPYPPLLKPLPSHPAPAWPSPAQICEGINDALEHAQNDQVRVSAARWTARDNLVLTGSPDTTAQSLQLATPTILGNNPAYASLHVTQRPSWVRNPDSYSNNTVSSLVVAFEDPDSSLARGLLASKVLFIFGNCATIRKWKQRPLTRKSKTESTPNAPNPQPHTQPPHESVPTSPVPPQFVFGLDLDPTPSHAGLPSRSAQDMEGESDNAGRSRTITRSSNNNKT
ncbi:hypothetical protein EDB85DRAFT_1896607 [Lactarius pseudohatsudake]|nr:hypothetical protein EDB85DRAFT_1896607 [Lactarius pseudohatsudake]